MNVLVNAGGTADGVGRCHDKRNASGTMGMLAEVLRADVDTRERD